MRYFVTCALILAVAGGVAWIGFGDEILTSTGLRPAPTPGAAESVAIPVLEQLTPAAIQKIDLTPPGAATLTLTRGPDGNWSQNGNWPVRQGEVNALVNTLTSLRTRFLPIRLEGVAADLKLYGLADDQKPAKVVVQREGRAITLTFGQPPLSPGESPFARPTFVRVDDTPELLRLGPDVFATVTTNPAAYRRRQLLPDAERVRFTADTAADPLNPAPASNRRLPLLGDAFDSIQIVSANPAQPIYTLKRIAPTPHPRRDPDRPTAEPALAPPILATAWELDATKMKEGIPVAYRDRVEPAQLKAILTGLADLWVEQFVTPSPAEAWFANHEKPAYTITFNRTDGRRTTLELGKVARTVTKTEDRPPPPPFGAPPPPPKVTTEEYRYARLVGNDLIFEVRTDTLAAALADPAGLRDAQLARFDTDAVRSLTITRPNQPPIVLTKKLGNKEATDADARADRWTVGNILAETGKVTELLTQLVGLQATPDDRIDGADTKKLAELGFDPKTETTLTVTVQPRTAEGEAEAAPRTLTYKIGQDDTAKKKLAVMLAGWPRVSLVDDAIAKLIDRPALAYRGRRLFDTAEAQLASVAVQKAGGDTFTLTRQPNWHLTAPITTRTDGTKADTFTGNLARLEAVEYVDDAPKPDDLGKKYGLTQPRFTIRLGFTSGPARTLTIGTSPAGKPDAFAQLDGTGSVFTIAGSVVESLNAGALALLPAEVWNTVSDRITAIEIRRGAQAQNESYRLTRAGVDWKLGGPLDAPVGFAQVQPLLGTLATLKVEKYEALTATNPAQYGFDKPSLRLTLTYTEAVPAQPGQPSAERTVSQSLIVGKSAPGATPGWFARLDDPQRPSVFVIPAAIPSATDRAALAWLDRNLLTIDPARITQVRIDGPKPEEDITLTRGQDGKWAATGAQFPVDVATIADVVATAGRLPVEQLAGYGAGVDWNRFGLTQPTHTLTLTLKPANTDGQPETHTLQLGKAEPSGQRYVRVDNGPALGILSAAVAADLTRNRLAFVDRTLFQFDPATLTGMTRVQGTNTLALEQTGINWEIVKPTKEKADQPTLDELAERLARLRADRVAAFAPKPAELAPFGLDKPTATLTLTVGLETPSTRTLRLGKLVDEKKPAAGRYAVVVPVDPKAPLTVAVLPTTLTDQLLAGPLAFQDRTLARFVDADRIQLTRGERTITFRKVGGSWKVTAPLSADAEQGALDDLINTVARLRAAEWVAVKPKELKPFGLDSPEAQWQFFSGDKAVLSLSLGKHDPKTGRVYVQTAGSAMVAQLDTRASEQLLGEYRRREVFTGADASAMNTLAVSGASGNFVLQKGPNGQWVDPAKPMEKIDQAKVTDTLAAFATLSANPYVVDKNAKRELYGLKEPKRVIVVSQKNGVTWTLHLGGPVAGSDGKQVYGAVVDPQRSDVFALNAEATMKLTRTRSAFLAR
ncbi:MAG: DUF4340 domain-containing protein [Bacteroidales bacterium]|nr:DUF4340 domain-containing protein [Bacteroidales bacterium]